jgi:hypothetical protein
MKKGKSSGVICTERMATHGPVMTIATVTATMLQPSLEGSRRFRTVINKEWMKKSTYCAAIARPWIRSRRKMVGSITLPASPVSS